jgi:hypothetical protein
MTGNTFLIENGFYLCIVINLFGAAGKIPDQSADYNQNKKYEKSFNMKHRLQQHL